jgi:hypothetical protein
MNEPNVADDQLVIRAREKEFLADIDIDLERFVARWSIGRRRMLFFAFRRFLVPRILDNTSQVGIKEIFHANWRRIERAFPNLRIVLTARDPRDIFLSLRSRHAQGTALWSGEFSPARVAASLNEEFRRQQEMARAHEVLKIRYEDLCLEPNRIHEVIEFVESDIRSISRLGSFLAADKKRALEGALHGGQITDQRVGRWRQESCSEAVEAAHEVFCLMPEYCEYWEYAEPGH